MMSCLIKIINSLLPGVVAIIYIDGRATVILQTPKRQIQRAWLAQSVEHETLNLEYSFCYVHQYIVEILSSKKVGFHIQFKYRTMFFESEDR